MTSGDITRANKPQRFTMRDRAALMAHHALRATPIWFCSWIGGALARLIAPRAFAISHGRAQDNLKRIRPDLTDREIKRMVRDNWDHIGRCYTEFSVSHRIMNQGRVTVDGLGHVEAVLASNTPLIVANCHLGNSAAIPAILAWNNIKVTALIELSGNPAQDEITRRSRTHDKVTQLAGGQGALKKCVDALKAGDTLSIFIDNIAQGRVSTPLFGRPLEPRGNVAFIPRLAALTGAKVILAYCQRLGGANFKVVFSEPLTLASKGRNDRKLTADIALIDARTTRYVSDNLDQWFMLHRLRFDR